MKPKIARWIVWGFAAGIVLTAHALVGTVLVAEWQPADTPASAAPMVVALAPVASSKSRQSHQKVEAPKPVPKPVKKYRPVRKPKVEPEKKAPEKKTQPAKPKPQTTSKDVPQKQTKHINAESSEQTRAAKKGTAEKLKNAQENWYGLVESLLQKHKRYPRLALLRHQEGTAIVHFVVDRKGRLQSVKLKDSSGYRFLDSEAISLVKRVAPFPAPPDAFKGGVISLTVPVAFRIAR